MTTYIIQSIQTPQEFWSNNLGWVSVESADRFTGDLADSPEEGHRATLKTEDGSELNLPLGGTWVPAFNDPYQCENCERVAERDDLPSALLISERMEPGDTYTDVECRECGALCFPVEDPEPQPRELTTTVFSETEMLEILEIARVALQDGEFFDQVCYDTDLADDYMVALRDKLQAVMDSDVRIFDPK
jgi:hypothetical protein